MAAAGTSPALNLRENLAKLMGLLFWKRSIWLLTTPIQDEGDASQTDWVLPRGQRPYLVLKAGVGQIKGSGDDYTVTQDGDVYTVVFAVAPGSGVSVQILPEVKQ